MVPHPERQGRREPVFDDDETPNRVTQMNVSEILQLFEIKNLLIALVLCHQNVMLASGYAFSRWAYRPEGSA